MSWGQRGLLSGLSREYEEALRSGAYGRGFGFADPIMLIALNNYPSMRKLLATGGSSIPLLLNDCVVNGGTFISENKIVGATEIDGVDYAPVYDFSYYTERYDDAPRDYFDSEKTLRHFIEKGIPEGRRGSYRFDVRKYKESHRVLARIYGDDYGCYIRHYLSAVKKGSNYMKDYRYV